MPPQRSENEKFQISRSGIFGISNDTEWKPKLLPHGTYKMLNETSISHISAGWVGE